MPEIEAVVELLRQRPNLRNRTDAVRWRDDWTEAVALLRASEHLNAMSTRSSATSDELARKLTWTTDREGRIHSAMGPLGHHVAVATGATGASWHVSDEDGRTIATGQHSWLSEAKRQAARACPGAKP